MSDIPSAIRNLLVKKYGRRLVIQTQLLLLIFQISPLISALIAKQKQAME
jgi:hypothetical protein